MKKVKALAGGKFSDYPLLVPKSFLSRINVDDSDDPLLLQVLPDKRENRNISGFNKDPLQEGKYTKIPGLIHKYHGRVLLLVTDECAINCRFCFRRHLSGKINDWLKVFSYIKNDSTIDEVILSGGDPLMLRPSKLKNILDKLSSIDHVKRIRIHSRMPIVMPEKINIKALRTKKPLVLVIHCNHPNELDNKVIARLKLITGQGVAIFNQSVLLKNINDNVDTLIALNEKLFSIGIIPYYLHILDKVKGSAHFYVDLKKAKKTYLAMKERLAGYLVPKLVIETKKGKRYV